MLLSVIHNFGGLVRLRIKGSYLERFLNICAKNDICFFSVHRISIDEMTVSVSAQDFKKLRSFARKTRCRIHIMEKHGLPFILRRFRKRYVLWGGLFFFCALLYILSAYIWVINVKFPEGIDGHQLMDDLAALGVHTGVRASSIDVDAIKSKMMEKNEKLSFIALNISGNELEIDLQVRKEKPVMMDTYAISSIVAKKDGVITKFDVKSGYPLKKTGQTVLKGEMMVSALMQPSREDAQPRLVHSMADIQARTWYNKARKLNLNTKRKLYSGEEKTKYALVFGKKRINLYFDSSISADSCDKIVEVKRIKISDYLSLPVALVKQTYVFYETSEETLDAKQVSAFMEIRAKQQIEAIIDGEIVSINHKIKSEGNSAVLYTSAECVENIGMEVVDDRKIEDFLKPEDDDKKQ